MSNQVLYAAEAGHRSGAGGPSAHIVYVHGGREDSGNEQFYSVVVTGCGVEGIVTRRIFYFLK